MIQIPSDCREMTESMRVIKGGICGQSCLAVIEKSSIKNILMNWKKVGLDFKGYSGWKQLREYLKKRGYEVKQKRSKDLKFLFEKFYILRIQWIGEGEKKEKPFYGYGHWAEASAYTHFIVVKGNEFFCNEYGLFNIDKLGHYLSNYNAVITSALEINYASSQHSESGVKNG